MKTNTYLLWMYKWKEQNASHYERSRIVGCVLYFSLLHLYGAIIFSINFCIFSYISIICKYFNLFCSIKYCCNRYMLVYRSRIHLYTKILYFWVYVYGFMRLLYPNVSPWLMVPINGWWNYVFIYFNKYTDDILLFSIIPTRRTRCEPVAAIILVPKASRLL